MNIMYCIAPYNEMPKLCLIFYLSPWTTPPMLNVQTIQLDAEHFVHACQAPHTLFCTGREFWVLTFFNFQGLEVGYCMHNSLIGKSSFIGVFKNVIIHHLECLKGRKSKKQNHHTRLHVHVWTHSMVKALMLCRMLPEVIHCPHISSSKAFCLFWPTTIFTDAKLMNISCSRLLHSLMHVFVKAEYSLKSETFFIKIL